MKRLNSSWLNGKYQLSGTKVEINTSLSYISIEFRNGESYFFQGNDADEMIVSICDYWNNTPNVTTEQAILHFVSLL